MIAQATYLKKKNGNFKIWYNLKYAAVAWIKHGSNIWIIQKLKIHQLHLQSIQTFETAGDNISRNILFCTPEFELNSTDFAKELKTTIYQMFHNKFTNIRNFNSVFFFCNTWSEIGTLINLLKAETTSKIVLSHGISWQISLKFA